MKIRCFCGRLIGEAELVYPDGRHFTDEDGEHLHGIKVWGAGGPDRTQAQPGSRRGGERSRGMIWIEDCEALEMGLDPEQLPNEIETTARFWGTRAGKTATDDRFLPPGYAPWSLGCPRHDMVFLPLDDLSRALRHGHKQFKARRA